MRISNNRIVLVNSIMLILFFCCWGCQEDPLDSGGREKLRPGQLTVEEARDLFEKYATNVGSRGVETDDSRGSLNPGIITPTWEDATLSTTRVNSFVNVPVGTAHNYRVKSPYNEDWVEVSQKLVVVQEDATQRRSVYLLNLIPEGDFAVRHKNGIADLCDAEQLPEDFSGLAVYTKTRGGLPVYVESYWEGQLEENVFLFDKDYTFEENLERINTLLYGYTLQGDDVILSRSSSEGGGGYDPGAGDSWQFHTEGNSFIYDGWTCWNSSDGKGNNYVVADTNGDGKPDTIINTGGGDVVGGGDHGSTTDPDPGIGFPDPGTDPPTPGGDVNPGTGTHPGGGSGSGNIGDKDDKMTPQGKLSKLIFSDKSQLTKEQWDIIEEVLENINHDCMGGKLIGTLNNKNIQLMRDSKLSSSGMYSHSTHQLELKNISDKKDVEGLLLHELLHSKQIHNPKGKLNLEIEVYYAVYRYAIRNKRVAIIGLMYQSMNLLDISLDEHYNIMDDYFNDAYEKVIEDIRKVKNYNAVDYPESTAARNFNMIKELSVDCNK